MGRGEDCFTPATDGRSYKPGPARPQPRTPPACRRDPSSAHGGSGLHEGPPTTGVPGDIPIAIAPSRKRTRRTRSEELPAPLRPPGCIRCRRKFVLLGQSGEAPPGLVDLETERTLLRRNHRCQQPAVGLPMHPRRLARQRVEEVRPPTEPHPLFSRLGDSAGRRGLGLARIDEATGMRTNYLSCIVPPLRCLVPCPPSVRWVYLCGGLKAPGRSEDALVGTAAPEQVALTSWRSSSRRRRRPALINRRHLRPVGRSPVSSLVSSTAIRDRRVRSRTLGQLQPRAPSLQDQFGF
jgi:hypothetical protein